MKSIPASRQTKACVHRGEAQRNYPPTHTWPNRVLLITMMSNSHKSKSKTDNTAVARCKTKCRYNHREAQIKVEQRILEKNSKESIKVHYTVRSWFNNLLYTTTGSNIQYWMWIDLTSFQARSGGRGRNARGAPVQERAVWMNKMWFTRTHEDTVHPPPSKVADWSLQCQRRSPQQEETPSYSFSLQTLHKWLLCLWRTQTMYGTEAGQ